MIKAISIEVIAPTKGRHDRAFLMARSFADTKALDSTDMLLALDEDDPWLGHYLSGSTRKEWYAIPCPTGSMVKRTNLCARTSMADIIGWAADDNMFITTGWDLDVIRAFDNPKVTTVNTNDLLVGDTKGGVFFVRNSVVAGLGWLFPPVLEHLYADYAVTELAKAAGTYLYLPGTIIEHQHPYAGKAPWDAQYHSYNNAEQDAKDGLAFRQWRESAQFLNDVEVLRNA